MTFTAAEQAACDTLVSLALAEDLGPDPKTGDVTSLSLIGPDRPGKAVFVARSPGVIAGLDAVRLVLERIDPRLTFRPLLEDGTKVEPGTRLAEVSGPAVGLLMAERTALNFLQRLSGVATMTRRYVDAVAE